MEHLESADETVWLGQSAGGRRIRHMPHAPPLWHELQVGREERDMSTAPLTRP